MKRRYLAFILAAVMIVSLAACGKKDKETTAVPTSEVPATAAPTTREEPTTAAPTTVAPTTVVPTTPEPTTEVPTTPEPTTPEPTTPEPTTEPEPVTEPAPVVDKDAKPDDVFKAVQENLFALLKSVGDKDAEARQFTIAGEAGALIEIRIEIQGEKLTLSVSGEGNANVQADTAKGILADAEYSSDYTKLAAMFQGEDPNEAEDVHGAYSAIVDLENLVAYVCGVNEEDPGQWYYTPVEDARMLDPEMTFETVPVEDVFKTVDFEVTDSGYVLSGVLNTEGMIPAEALGEVGEEIPIEDIVIHAELRCDAEKQLTFIHIWAEELVIDLSSILEGLGGQGSLTAALSKLDVVLAIDYDTPVDFEVPADVEANALPMDEYDPNEEPGHPWAENEFVTKDEVLLDSDVLKFTVNGVEDDDWYGLILHVTAENKTDKKLNLSPDDFTVMGYLCDGYGSETLDPKGSVSFDIKLDEDGMLAAGLTDLDEICFSLKARDADDYWADPLVNETLVLYPTGLTADEIVYPERVTAETEKVIVEKEEYTAVILSVEKDPYMGFVIKYYLENNTEKKLEFDFSDKDVKVNGSAVNVYWNEDVPAGAKGYFESYISDSELKELGITKVEKLEFALTINDAEDWFADPIEVVEAVFEAE